MAGDRIGHARALLHGYRKALEERSGSGLYSVVIRSSRADHPSLYVGGEDPGALPMPPLPEYFRGKSWGFQWSSWPASPVAQVIFFGDNPETLREDHAAFARIADLLGRLIPSLVEMIRAVHAKQASQALFDEATQLAIRARGGGCPHVAWVALTHSLLGRADGGTGPLSRHWAWDDRLQFDHCPIPYREEDRGELPDWLADRLARIEPVRTEVAYSTLEHNLFRSSVLAIDELLGSLPAASNPGLAFGIPPRRSDGSRDQDRVSPKRILPSHRPTLERMLSETVELLRIWIPIAEDAAFLLETPSEVLREHPQTEARVDRLGGVRAVPPKSPWMLADYLIFPFEQEGEPPRTREELVGEFESRYRGKGGAGPQAIAAALKDLHDRLIAAIDATKACLAKVTLTIVQAWRA